MKLLASSSWFPCIEIICNARPSASRLSHSFYCSQGYGSFGPETGQDEGKDGAAAMDVGNDESKATLN